MLWALLSALDSGLLKASLIGRAVELLLDRIIFLISLDKEPASFLFTRWWVECLDYSRVGEEPQEFFFFFLPS